MISMNCVGLPQSKFNGWSWQGVTEEVTRTRGAEKVHRDESGAIARPQWLPYDEKACSIHIIYYREDLTRQGSFLSQSRRQDEVVEPDVELIESWNRSVCHHFSIRGFDGVEGEIYYYRWWDWWFMINGIGTRFFLSSKTFCRFARLSILSRDS